MAMKKYTTASEFEVLAGREANVLNEHFGKTGKRVVSDFSDEEREALVEDLNEAREQPDEQLPERKLVMPEELKRHVKEKLDRKLEDAVDEHK